MYALVHPKHHSLFFADRFSKTRHFIFCRKTIFVYGVGQYVVNIWQYVSNICPYLPTYGTSANICFLEIYLFETDLL